MKKFVTLMVLICGIFLVGWAAVTGLNMRPAAMLERSEGKLITQEAAFTKINAARAEAAWRNWMVDNGITQSSLAIGRAGSILHSAGEMRDPRTPYPMASLSKAITAMCLNQILSEGPYSWGSTLADLAPEFAKMNFTPAAQMADLTLAQIATHTSGLPKELEYGVMSTRSSNLSSQPTMAKAALKEFSNFGPRGGYIYSNANYAILGFLTEAITGKPYGDYCKAAIMDPSGATQAGILGRMAYAAGYGGWSVSVEDYARFAMHWFDPDQPWMQSPEIFAYDKAAEYGMGTYVYPTTRGTFVSHTGRWTHADPRKDNIGSLFFVREDGTTVVINWDSSLDHAQYLQLHQAVRDSL